MNKFSTATDISVAWLLSQVLYLYQISEYIQFCMFRYQMKTGCWNEQLTKLLSVLISKLF